MAVNWEKIARAKLHPIQAMIVDKMSEGGEWSAKRLADQFDHPLSNTYYHVKQLRDAGIVVEVRTEPSGGGVEHFHVLA